MYVQVNQFGFGLELIIDPISTEYNIYFHIYWAPAQWILVCPFRHCSTLLALCQSISAENGLKQRLKQHSLS